jgi:hypothetical protein
MAAVAAGQQMVGGDVLMDVTTPTTTTPTDEALAEFAAAHPELMEAMELFGIASAEYDRALRALYPVTMYTSTSTADPR